MSIEIQLNINDVTTSPADPHVFVLIRTDGGIRIEWHLRSRK